MLIWCSRHICLFINVDIFLLHTIFVETVMHNHSKNVFGVSKINNNNNNNNNNTFYSAIMHDISFLLFIIFFLRKTNLYEY